MKRTNYSLEFEWHFKSSAKGFFRWMKSEMPDPVSRGREIWFRTLRIGKFRLTVQRRIFEANKHLLE